MKTHSFVHAGVAAVLAAAIVTASGLISAVGAGSSTPTSFVAITPCRLADTRPGSGQTGPRATPLNTVETLTIAVWGSNGQCTIPTTAAGVVANVTIVNGTAKSYLTVFPSDVARPTASNLNWVAGGAATPNQVTVGLSATGALSVYNNAGKVDLIIDLVGYQLSATPNPAHVLWVATNGTNPSVVDGSVPVFASIQSALASISDNSALSPYVIKVAPGIYDEFGGIDLKSFVDIEGSGPGITTLTCECGYENSPAVDSTSATVRAQGPFLRTSIRNLTVVNTGTDVYSTGIWADTIIPGALVLEDLTVVASGGFGQYGIWNTNASPIMRNLTVSTIGNGTTSTESFGIVNSDLSNPVMDAIEVTAEGALTTIGIRVTGNSIPVITNVTSTAKGINNASANSFSVYVLGSTFTVEGSRLHATLGNGSAHAWSLGVGSSGATVTLNNSFLGSLASVTAVAGSTVKLQRSTFYGQLAGAGTYRCAFNTDSVGNELAGC